jgi:hypothetical protein
VEGQEPIAVSARLAREECARPALPRSAIDDAHEPEEGRSRRLYHGLCALQKFLYIPSIPFYSQERLQAVAVTGYVSQHLFLQYGESQFKQLPSVEDIRTIALLCCSLLHEKYL